jgi:hypothetical protein
MAWTAPKTWVAATTLTAAELNTHLRDNLLELAPAKATTPSSIFVASGTNSIGERTPDIDTISTSETTTSAAYADLATVGPSVTVTAAAASSKALIMHHCRMSNSLADTGCYASWALSGATVRGALDDTASKIDGMAAGNFAQVSDSDLFGGLASGTTTITMKYKVDAGTGTFSNRTLIVVML